MSLGKHTKAKRNRQLAKQRGDSKAGAYVYASLAALGLDNSSHLPEQISDRIAVSTLRKVSYILENRLDSICVGVES